MLCGILCSLAVVQLTGGLDDASSVEHLTACGLLCPIVTPEAVSCNPSKKELKEASAAFAKGLKLQREKRQDEAFDQFETAARLDPKDVEFVTARELTRQRLVFDHLERGDDESRQGRQREALAECRRSPPLEPQHE